MKTFNFKARLKRSGRRRTKDGLVQSVFSFGLEPGTDQQQIYELFSKTHVLDKKLLENIIDPTNDIHNIDGFHTAAVKRIKDVMFAGEEIPGFQFIDSLIFKKKIKQGNPEYHYTLVAYCDPEAETAVFEKGFLNYKEEVENPDKPGKVKKKFKWFDFKISISSEGKTVPKPAVEDDELDI